MERLINYFTPNSYILTLSIDKHKKTARGNVIILGSPHSDTIKLHSKDLTIDRLRLDDEISKFSIQDDILEFPKAQKIEIDYHFTLNENMEGCYLSSYDYDNYKEFLVSTQFESHYARQCFPCIDEPEAKATFDLSITIPDEDKDDVVISNMPIKSKQGMTTIFETTPKMSTYLLAFCIGRFQKKSRTSDHGHKVTTYCALNQDKDSVDFANEIACAALDFYDQKFGIKYPLEKLDQVAIPDFEAGAMENWGLVTYRESCLLATKNASIVTKEYIALVVAHELSHQWFGNLVTMKWWNNLWLNESFANLMERLCVDCLHPEYKTFEDYFTTECVYSLSHDALPGVQAVQQEVNDPADIATLFDSAIVYAKGSRLLFMLYRILGEKNFYAGLKDYFRQYKYSNTEGDDLWNAFQPYSEFNVKEFMDAWILQPGFPVITDETQQRFLLTGATDDTTWPLPEITDDMSGYYILNLSGQEFSEKLNQFESLSTEQKIRLLSDRSLLGKTSLVSSARHFDLIQKFTSETNFTIWDMITNLISDLKLFFYPDNPDFPLFQSFISSLVSANLSMLGLIPKKTDSENELKLRQALTGLALYADNKTIISNLAKEYQPDLSALNPEFRHLVLLAKLKSNEEIFSDLVARYPTESDPELRSDLLSVFSSSKTHCAELINLLEKPEIVRPQDNIYLYANLLRNYKTKPAAVSWFYSHWTYVKSLTGEKTLDDYIRATANSVRTSEESTAFNDFCSEISSEPGLTRSITVGKSAIASRLRLLMMDNDDVHRHLKSLAF
ncbi:MAG: M1 family metallopeptidase [Candidatus Saccharibacteria bacterium]|nr:M1 family metallopeptidase [Candidatus Saccharibacteria bacterium]